MSLEECTRKGQQLGIHILVVAYRSTAHYNIKAQQNRCLVRWASQTHCPGLRISLILQGVTLEIPSDFNGFDSNLQGGPPWNFIEFT